MHFCTQDFSSTIGKILDGIARIIPLASAPTSVHCSSSFWHVVSALQHITILKVQHKFGNDMADHVPLHKIRPLLGETSALAHHDDAAGHVVPPCLATTYQLTYGLMLTISSSIYQTYSCTLICEGLPALEVSWQPGPYFDRCTHFLPDAAISNMILNVYEKGRLCTSAIFATLLIVTNDTKQNFLIWLLIGQPFNLCCQMASMILYRTGLQPSKAQSNLWQGFKQNDFHVPVHMKKTDLLETKYKQWQPQDQGAAVRTTYEDASTKVKDGTFMKREPFKWAAIPAVWRVTSVFLPWAEHLERPPSFSPCPQDLTLPSLIAAALIEYCRVAHRHCSKLTFLYVPQYV